MVLLYIYNGILWHKSVLFQVHFIDTKTDFWSAKKYEIAYLAI